MKPKDLLNIVGLLPTILALFQPFPPWFRPKPSLSTEGMIIATMAAIVAFVFALVFWSKDYVQDTKRKRLALIGVGWFGGAFISGLGYLAFAKAFPQASLILDILQLCMWALFFWSLSLGLTVLFRLWRETFE